MATAVGLGCSREKGRRRPYIGELKAVEGLTCTPRRREAVRVAAWAVGRAATCVRATQGTAARPEVERRGGDTWRAWACGAGQCGASGRGHSARTGGSRPVSACDTVAGRCATCGTTRDVARVGANGWCRRPAAIDLALFNCVLLQIFQQKWAA
jgi:hypothetical protein